MGINDDYGNDERERNPDKIWIEDAHGEYHLSRGHQDPDGEYSDRCNAVLEDSYQRYGEARYCGQYPLNNQEFCWTHRGRRQISAQNVNERVKHAAQVEGYRRFLNRLPPYKKVIAITTFKSLREDSVFDFDDGNATEHVVEVNTSEADWTEQDVVEIDIPLGSTDRQAREKALLAAACELMKIESMNEQLFHDAFDPDKEGGVGEREVTLTVTDSGVEITQMEEHHLNLPLSRCSSDFENYLEFGGVGVEDEDDISAEVRDWEVTLGPSEEDKAPSQRVSEEDRVTIGLEEGAS